MASPPTTTITDAAPASMPRTAWPSMLMPPAPPLVSCSSQRSDMPKRQAMSIDLSGSIENEEIARPSTSDSLRLASLQRHHHRVAQERMGVLARLGMARVARLACSDDDCTAHAWLPWPASVLHSDQRVDDDRAVAAGDDRIEIDLADRRIGRDDLGQPRRDRGDRVAIDRRHAAVAVEQALRAQPAERRADRVGRGRRAAEHHVVEHLGEDAADRRA